MPKVQSKIDIPEKLAAWGTQEEEKHNITCVGHHYTQTNTSNVNKTWDSIEVLYQKSNIWHLARTLDYDTIFRPTCCTMVSTPPIYIWIQQSFNGEYRIISDKRP